ncbi:hypothetical protein CPC08DRAFT_691565 [Agrocybe pediades]|nr:hypothetical protein CPC08DRAFT_691565 [Agrocybe pediades]
MVHQSPAQAETDAQVTNMSLKHSREAEMQGDMSESDKRLLELGYRVEFRREMPFFGVLGMYFCAIGILTGMGSAFQTGLFSGGPLGLFWGWNVREDCDLYLPHLCKQI